MNKIDFLKLFAAAVFGATLVAGCASDPVEEPAPAPAPVQEECPSAEAKNAIYSAKIKLARAEKLGYAWRDTAQMIKDAEKAAAGCDNDKAIELANKAAEQAEDAIAQYNAEQERFNETHGSVEGGEMAMASEYTVESGDNLWSISSKDSVYGNPYQWPLIYKANSDLIEDADLIYPGQVFSVPSASADEIDAAVQHAKTRGSWSIGAVEASDKEYLAQ